MMSPHKYQPSKWPTSRPERPPPIPSNQGEKPATGYLQQQLFDDVEDGKLLGLDRKVQRIQTLFLAGSRI